MQHLHYEFHLNAGDQVIVNLDKQANVQLMDTNNYSNYRSSRRYTYFGGLVKRSPFTIAPRQGRAEGEQRTPAE